MAVSKRLRFEILRRDNHTCRYCGASAPDVKLVVDHVKPEALGGKTEPGNLVTACEDCNSGKTSMAPNAEMVADVEADAARWAAAMARAAEAYRSAAADARAYAAEFHEVWSGYTVGTSAEPVPLPDDWPEALERFRVAGLPIDVVLASVRPAMANEKVATENVFRYFCGVCWNQVGEMQELAEAILQADATAPARTYVRPPVAGPDSPGRVAAREAAARAASAEQRARKAARGDA